MNDCFEMRKEAEIEYKMISYETQFSKTIHV